MQDQGCRVPFGHVEFVEPEKGFQYVAFGIQNGSDRLGSHSFPLERIDGISNNPLTSH